MKFPTSCPSCDAGLTVHVLKCTRCSTQVTGDFDLPELIKISREEQEFIMKFFLASGSIKEMAKEYQVSYPTMRNKIDDLINKIKQNQSDI